MRKKVVIGLSGGVDSSVAAWLLLQEGYEVEALFMINWKERVGALTSSCSWEDDLLLAQMVARRLKIPLHTVDLSDYYKRRVVDYMFAEYQKGRTPNPDILCNREIKFDVFVEEARRLGADYVATGHYCRKGCTVQNNHCVYHLLAGHDTSKDQSYFLCQITQKQLTSALFPIGHLTKKEVRRIAAEQQLETATRKDSQGICFVGKVDLPTFLQQKLVSEEGDVIEIPDRLFVAAPYEAVVSPKQVKELTAPFLFSPDMGRVVGKHQGAWFFTVGQRKGLGVGGKKEPLFVLATDTDKNVVYAGQGHHHFALNRRGLFIEREDFHYLVPHERLSVGERREYAIRIRYRQPLQRGVLYRYEEGYYVLFESLQRGITEGQFAAFYHEDELVASGAIGTTPTGG